MVRTTCPSLPMRMNALGTKPVESAASASWPAKGNWRQSIKPPPAAAVERRNLRRERPIAATDSVTRALSMLSVRVISASLGLRGLLDGFANAQIGSAATDVAGHGVVDVGIGGVLVACEQGCGRHDLARLAVAAL